MSILLANGFQLNQLENKSEIKLQKIKIERAKILCFFFQKKNLVYLVKEPRKRYVLQQVKITEKYFQNI